MAHTNEDHIKLLNGLIETTLDSADGYREAAKEADNPRYKSMFESRASERQSVTRDLQSEVRRLGGEPEDDGTMLAGAHRMFLKLKDSMTGDDKSVVNDVEAGEDHIKAKYEKALQDRDVEPQTRTAIEKAYASVKQGHDQMRDLKHSLQGR